MISWHIESPQKGLISHTSGLPSLYHGGWGRRIAARLRVALRRSLGTIRCQGSQSYKVRPAVKSIKRDLKQSDAPVYSDPKQWTDPLSPKSLLPVTHCPQGNRKLVLLIYQEMTRSHIKIFPQQWTTSAQFQLGCSSPPTQTFIWLIFLRQSLPMDSRMAWDSLASPGWPPTRSTPRSSQMLGLGIYICPPLPQLLIPNF